MNETILCDIILPRQRQDMLNIAMLLYKLNLYVINCAEMQQISVLYSNKSTVP